MKHSEGFLKLVNDAKSRIREVTVDGNTRTHAGEQRGSIDRRPRRSTSGMPRTPPAPNTSAKASSNATSKPTVPDKSTEVILYCGGGFRSALAADVLQQMGYTNVFSMAGGWKAWKDSGARFESDNGPEEFNGLATAA